MDPDGCSAGEVIYFGKAQQVRVDGGADQRTTVAMPDRYVSLPHCEAIAFVSSLVGVVLSGSVMMGTHSSRHPWKKKALFNVLVKY